MRQALEILERQAGFRIRGYRSPSWDISLKTLGLLVEYGFSYDSSLMDDDAPYVHDVDGSRLVELPVQWHLDDFPYWGYAPRRRRPRAALQPRGRDPHLDRGFRHPLPGGQVLHPDPSSTGLRAPEQIVVPGAYHSAHYVPPKGRVHALRRNRPALDRAGPFPRPDPQASGGTPWQAYGPETPSA